MLQLKLNVCGWQYLSIFLWFLANSHINTAMLDHNCSYLTYFTNFLILKILVLLVELVFSKKKIIIYNSFLTSVTNPVSICLFNSNFIPKIVEIYYLKLMRISSSKNIYRVILVVSFISNAVLINIICMYYVLLWIFFKENSGRIKNS